MIHVYRSGIHVGEEKRIVGNDAAGMVYFSGCHLSCDFCYTPETSRTTDNGIPLQQSQFRQRLEELVSLGARNLNLVSPSHVWNEVEGPLAQFARSYQSHVPIVIKTSGFESQAMIERMAKVADVFVPDFKAWAPGVAATHQLPAQYGKVAVKSLQAMAKTHGALAYNDQSEIVRGIVLRHLMLPNRFLDSSTIVDKLIEIGFSGYLNLLTRFIDKHSRGLVSAPRDQVLYLANTAERYGIRVLINGVALALYEEAA